jgi:7-carboxy-7-deazaguanine synthase
MAESKKEKALKITEIFYSIQGESSRIGQRTAFIRLTGCPLRCNWCDTTYSFTGGEWMSLNQILEKIKSFSVKYVCITGGEPLSQKNCLELVKKLYDNNYKISIETSGEKPVEEYVPFAKIIMDIKTPSSGEKAQIAFENLNKLQPKDEIKFIIQDRNDFEWSKDICKKFNLTKKFQVLFSPVFGVMNFEELASWILEDKLDVRLQIQLHKIIWGANKTGV